jgi:outer membrane protein, heavy metal efflux system
MADRLGRRHGGGLREWTAASCWLLVLPLAARPAAGEAWTLEAAVARAMEANPAIAAARLRGPIDTAGLGVARQRPNPEAGLEVENETPKQALSLAVPLELGGKRARRIEVGEAMVRAGEAELAATVIRVRSDVRRAYFGALVADERLQLMRERHDLALRVRAAAEARFDQGSAPRLEVLQAELSVAASENEAAAAEGAALAAGAGLATLLALPLDAPLELSSPLDSGPVPETEAALAAATTTSAALLAVDRQIEEQRARVALANALRVPDVTPAFTLTHDAQPDFVYGWRASLGVVVPLFTTHRADVVVEEATLAQLVAQREELLFRIRGDVISSAARAQAQQELYARYRDDILPQAEQVEALAEDAYELGQTGLAALLQALEATRDLRLRSLEAAEGLQTALADLEGAMGGPLQ